MSQIIEIKKSADTENGKWFLVNVGEGADVSEFEAILDNAYWEFLTEGVGDPAELIRRSFEFLLARDTIESIPKEFNLREIQKHFPDFESTIKNK